MSLKQKQMYSTLKFTHIWHQKYAGKSERKTMLQQQRSITIMHCLALSDWKMFAVCEHSWVLSIKTATRSSIIYMSKDNFFVIYWAKQEWMIIQMNFWQHFRSWLDQRAFWTIPYLCINFITMKLLNKLKKDKIL